MQSLGEGDGDDGLRWGGWERAPVEHEGLVDVAQAVNFVLGTLETDLQLVLDGVQVSDVAGCYIEG